MITKKRVITIVAILTLICVQYPLHSIINRERIKEGFIDRILYKPADVITMTVLAGFKGIAADILWVRIDDYSHAGQMYKLLPIFEMVTFLQPHFVLAWSLGGWQMAFNLYHEADTEKEKKRWLQAGINFLLKGIKYNPQDYHLYYDLGWTYWMKTKDYKKCIELFKVAVMWEHPQWVEHMLAHAYEKDGQLENAYKVWKNIQDKGSVPGLESVVDKFVKKLARILHEQRK